MFDVLLDAVLVNMEDGSLPLETHPEGAKWSIGFLDAVLKQFYTLSKEDAYSATVRCSVEQVPEVMAKLDHLGYTSVTPIYWHKVNTKKHSK